MALADRSRAPLGIPAGRPRTLPLASTFLLVCVGAVMLACSEYPTTPPPPRATAVADTLGAPPGGPGYTIDDNTVQLPPDVPEVWTITLGVPAVGLAMRQRVGDVPVGLLLVDVQATGTLNGQWLYPCPNCSLPPYPAAGRNQSVSCVGYVWIEGSAPGACQGGDISGRMHVADSVFVGRTEGPGIRLYNSLGGQLCGPLDCIGWSGSQTVTIRRLKTDLTLSGTLYGTTAPVPSEVWWGSAVMFTTDREVGTAGSAMPIYRFGMKWTPDPTSVPERTSVKACNPRAASCAPILYESGTYEAQGYVNGTGKTKQLHVDVRRRKLLLDLKPGQYVKRGTTVTWQGTRDYGVGGVFRDPRWSIDDTTATSKFSCTNYGWICTETALKDFTRTVTAIIDDSLQTKNKLVKVYKTFEIKPVKPTARVGEKVNFIAYLDSVPHPAARWIWHGTQTVEMPECAGQTICEVTMDAPGTPTMTAYLELEGGDMASASVDVGRLKVVVQQAQDGLLTPTWLEYHDSLCNVSAIPRRRTVLVWVEDGAGKRQANRTVSLELSGIERSGGHTHGGNRPVGALDRHTVVTDAGGTGRVQYLASEVAGDYIVRGTEPEAESGADTIHVGLRLEPFPTGPNHRLVGEGDALHESRFYTTSELREDLLWFAAEFARRETFRVGYNDMSIPLGGRFDEHGDFLGPHCSHRHGEAADVRTRDMTLRLRENARILWNSRRGPGKAVREGDHLHFK